MVVGCNRSYRSGGGRLERGACKAERLSFDLTRSVAVSVIRQSPIGIFERLLILKRSLTFFVPRDVLSHRHIPFLGYTAGFEPAKRWVNSPMRGFEPRRNSAIANLQNRLGIRFGRSSRTAVNHTPLCLTIIFYHFRERFARKKSCELAKVRSFW